MVYRRLGKSGLEISPIGLGCRQFSRSQGFFGKHWNEIAQKEVNAIVSTAAESGINWFDTAEAYGWGTSETALAIALDQLPKRYEDLHIATKWFSLLRTAGSMERSMAARAEALKEYDIDLYQIHYPYSISSMAKQMKVLAGFLRRGAVRSVGVSNFSERQMREAYFHLKAEGFDLVSNQVRFNLLDREIEKNGVLEAAKELGMTLIAYSPLAGGMLTGKYHDASSVPGIARSGRGKIPFMSDVGLKQTDALVRELEKIGSVYGVTIPQVALNWVINFYDDTVVAIPGATRTEHAESNAHAAEFRLTRNELDRLDELSQQTVRVTAGR